MVRTVLLRRLTPQVAEWAAFNQEWGRDFIRASAVSILNESDENTGPPPVPGLLEGDLHPLPGGNVVELAAKTSVPGAPGS